MTTKAGERLYELLDRVQPGPRGDVLRMGAIGSAIAAVEAEAVRDERERMAKAVEAGAVDDIMRPIIEEAIAEAVRDALTDLRAAVEGLDAGARWVRRTAVLAEIDKRMPGGAP